MVFSHFFFPFSLDYFLLKSIPSFLSSFLFFLKKAILCQDTLVVFGGTRSSSDSAWYNDVWYFDLATKAWTKEDAAVVDSGESSGTKGPSARAGHAAVHLLPCTHAARMGASSGETPAAGPTAGPADSVGGSQASATEAAEAAEATPDVGMMVVFGGCDADAVLLNDLWAFEYSTATWQCLSGGSGGSGSSIVVSGTSPAAREGAAMASFTTGTADADAAGGGGGSVYLYGGVGPEGQCLDDLYCLSMRSNQWVWQRIDLGGGGSGGSGGGGTGCSVAPGRRFLHTMCAVDGMLYVWGGASAATRNGKRAAADTTSICDTDLYTLNVGGGNAETTNKSNAWLRTPVSPAAVASSSASATLTPVPSATPISSVAASAQVVQRRCNHSCTVVSGGSALLFFGGMTSDGKASADLVLCKLGPLPATFAAAARPTAWSKLAVTGEAASLEKRFGHSGCFHQRSGQVLFFGGESGSDALGSVAVVRVDEQPRAALFAAFIALLVVAYILFIYCKVTGVLGEEQTRLT